MENALLIPYSLKFKIQTCLICFGLILFENAGSQIVSYGDPNIIEPSKVFSVKVNGQSVFTNSFMSYDYSHFAITGKVNIEVTFNEPITKGVVVTPTKYNIKPVIQGNKFIFSLDKPCKLFIRVNVKDAASYSASANDHHFLLIFVDPPEKNPPSPGEKNIISVLKYGADKTGKVSSLYAIREAIKACPDKGIVYFPAGKYTIDSAVLLNKPGITLYLEGGAFIQRVNGPQALVVTADGITIKGRGTIEAKAFALTTGNGAINKFLLEDIVLRDSYNASSENAFHMIANFSGLNDFKIKNIKGLGCPQNETYGKQRDGIAVRQSSNGVIEDIFVWSGDDAFYVTAGNYTAKNGRPQDGSKTENILVKNCLFRSEGGASAMKDMATLPIINLEFNNCVSLRGAIEIDSRAESGVQENILFRNIDIEELSRIGIAKLFSTQFTEAPINVRFENINYRSIWPGQSKFIIMSGNKVKIDFRNLIIANQLILNRSQLEKSGFSVTWEGDPVVSFRK